jgi:hypothetical protein
MRNTQAYLEEIEELTRRFIRGDLSFWPFWRKFMHLWVERCPDGLSLAQHDRWDRVYDLLYMGQPDPTPHAERAVGLIGEQELRSRVAEALAQS